MWKAKTNYGWSFGIAKDWSYVYVVLNGYYFSISKDLKFRYWQNVWRRTKTPIVVYK